MTQFELTLEGFDTPAVTVTAHFQCESDAVQHGICPLLDAYCQEYGVEPHEIFWEVDNVQAR